MTNEALPLEREILNDCIAYLNKRKDVWAWRRNIGLIKFAGRNKPSFARIGMKGMSDIEGIVIIKNCGPMYCRTCSDTMPEQIESKVFHNGIHLEVEVKRPGKNPSVEQGAWLAAIAAHGGIALVVHSKEELAEKLDAAIRDKTVGK